MNALTLICAGLVAVGSFQSFSAAPVTATNSTQQAAPPKSVFHEKLPGGKDPFFPTSTRRGDKVAVTTSTPVAPTVSLVSQLAIKYIAPDRNFVLLNDKTLGVGEEGAVRIQTGRVRIKVLEIKENSAVIEIEGDPEKREIKRRETF